MVPELIEYIKKKRAEGFADAEIRSVLIEVGWQTDVLDEVFEQAKPPVPIQEIQPEQLPAQTAASALNSAGQPALQNDPYEENAVPPKTYRGLLVTILITIILITLIGSGFLVFRKIIKSTLSQKDDAVVNTDQQQTAPPQTPKVQETNLFQMTGVAFSYDKSWKKTTAKEIFEGENSTIDEDESQFLFYSPEAWQETQTKLLTSDEKSRFGLLFIIPLKADFYINRYLRTSAREAALESTKTVCRKDSLQISTSNPTLPERLQDITVADKKAYLVMPEADCNNKTTTIYIDSNSTIYESPVKSTVPGVTITDHSIYSSDTDSFALAFTGASDLGHLSEGQKMIFESIVLP